MMKFIKDKAVILTLNILLPLLIGCIFGTTLGSAIGSGYRVIMYKQFAGFSHVSAKTERDEPDYAHIVSSFDSFQYWKLDLQEKTELLQEYADYLADELGMERHPVIVRQMWDDSVRAEFDYATEMIAINTRYLDLPEDVMNSVAHEICHAYQYSWVQLNECIKNDRLELFSIKDKDQLKLAESWEIEFRNYKNDTSDRKGMEEYENQLIEIGAREYAAEKTEELKRDIEQFRQRIWGTRLFNEPMAGVVASMGIIGDGVSGGGVSGGDGSF